MYISRVSLAFRGTRLFSTKPLPPSSPTTISYDKMSMDKRYQPTVEVPVHLQTSPTSVEASPGFSIRNRALEGRATYLDMQATTPVDPRVLDSMLPHMMGSYGNPHSRTHSYGWEAEAAVETARSQIAKLINCSPKEIVFTSGATESNNLCIKGVGRFYGKKKKHVITTQTEHKCVLDSCRQLEQEGFDVTYLPVTKSTGLVDLKVLEDAMRDDTSVVSIMAVNNEIGTLQPLKDIGELCRSRKVRRPR